MKLKCPKCNKTVTVYEVRGGYHCTLCDPFIAEVTSSPVEADIASETSNGQTINEINPVDQELYSEVMEETAGAEELDEDEEKDISEKTPRNKKKTKGTGKKKEKEVKVERGHQAAGIDLNEDGFYNDVLPAVLSEIDRLPKESILKAIAAVVGVFAVIVFLIMWF